MAVVAISMCRDEEDIAAGFVEHMLTQVDLMIVADNNSVDGTRQILDEFVANGAPLIVLDDPEIAYLQSEKMTRLAKLAVDFNAEWVVPADFDEWWYSPFGRIGDVLADIPPQYLTASAALYDHVATGADDDQGPLQRMGWRRRVAAPLPKVACRVRDDLVIEQGNHSATYRGGATDYRGQLVVRHFPYRSAEQMTRKAINGAAAYAATDLPEDVGAHWRRYGALIDTHGPEALHPVFREWFFVEEPEADPDLIFDPVWGLHA